MYINRPDRGSRPPRALLCRRLAVEPACCPCAAAQRTRDAMPLPGFCEPAQLVGHTQQLSAVLVRAALRTPCVGGWGVVLVRAGACGVVRAARNMNRAGRERGGGGGTGRARADSGRRRWRVGQGSWADGGVCVWGERRWPRAWLRAFRHHRSAAAQSSSSGGGVGAGASLRRASLPCAPGGVRTPRGDGDAIGFTGHGSRRRAR